MISRTAPSAIVAGLIVAGVWAAPAAQGTRSTWDGVYTETQARRGADLFDRECAQCHGTAGAGGSMAPALVGPMFSANYDGQTVGDLFERNRATMPIGSEGQLSGQQNADITAFMLQVNGFPAGAAELPTQNMLLKQIKYVAERPAMPQQERPAGTHQDNTSGTEWIKRLERPERISGLRLGDVINCLRLKPGDVIADIGAGTGAFTIPFAKAVAPFGRALAVDIWPELIDYIAAKGRMHAVGNLEGILAERDDPRLPPQQVDVAFFHDVFHNVNDRQAYLALVALSLKPGGRIAIVEQEFDDPIAKKWDLPEDRITREQVAEWMAAIGFRQAEEFDIFQGANNPKGVGMPERWFVVYERSGAVSVRTARE